MIALAVSNLRRVGTMLLYHGVVMLSSVGVGSFVRVGHGLGALSRVRFVRVDFPRRICAYMEVVEGEVYPRLRWYGWWVLSAWLVWVKILSKEC